MARLIPTQVTETYNYGVAQLQVLPEPSTRMPILFHTPDEHEAFALLTNTPAETLGHASRYYPQPTCKGK